MATPSQTPMMGAQPQGGAPPSPSGGSATEGMKMLAAITRLAQMLSQNFSATSPDMEQILSSVQAATRKVIAQQPQQPQQAPPF